MAVLRNKRHRSFSRIEVVIDMIVTLEEMKQYLRVDFPEDDSLIEHLISGAEKMCMDIIRTEDIDTLKAVSNAKTGSFLCRQPICYGTS